MGCVVLSKTDTGWLFNSRLWGAQRLTAVGLNRMVYTGLQAFEKPS